MRLLTIVADRSKRLNILRLELACCADQKCWFENLTSGLTWQKNHLFFVQIKFGISVCCRNFTVAFVLSEENW
jgi:hypothetical protein